MASNVIQLTKRRIKKATQARAERATDELKARIALLEFMYSEYDYQCDDGVGYLATHEEHEQFREFCAAFGFDIEEFPGAEQRFRLWHALADSLASRALMFLRSRSTFDIISRRWPAEKREYIRAVAEGDVKTARALRSQFVDYPPKFQIAE